ncbi:IS110 family transposase [Profundibacter sp.]|uniref:IS110 family transposase n=1 Tax=Profundibacter sp. TaxID=3101071 RepID=UPI003D10D0FB
MTNPDKAIYVGIDVSKNHLDVYVHPTGTSLQVRNDKSGHKKLARKLVSLDPRQIILEATGRYHRACARALHARGLPVAVVNPFRAHQFAAFKGQLAKTDSIDARTLAFFGSEGHALTTQPKPEHLQRLEDLMVARNQNTRLQTMISNQNSVQVEKDLRRQGLEKLALLKRQNEEIDTAMRGIIEADPALAARFTILKSVPSVGDLTAISLIASMPELGMCSPKQAASLIGVAPFNRESGTLRGNPAIRGGRTALRKILYMSALSAIRVNGPLKSFYQRLVENGKPAKVALVAVLRKLVTILNALVRENRPWRTKVS